MIDTLRNVQMPGIQADDTDWTRRKVALREAFGRAGITDTRKQLDLLNRAHAFTGDAWQRVARWLEQVEAGDPEPWKHDHTSFEKRMRKAKRIMRKKKAARNPGLSPREQEAMQRLRADASLLRSRHPTGTSVLVMVPDPKFPELRSGAPGIIIRSKPQGTDHIWLIEHPLKGRMVRGWYERRYIYRTNPCASHSRWYYIHKAAGHKMSHNPKRLPIVQAVEKVKDWMRKVGNAERKSAYKVQLSSGTLATLSGWTKYDDLDMLHRHAVLDLYHEATGEKVYANVRRNSPLLVLTNPKYGKKARRRLADIWRVTRVSTHDWLVSQGDKRHHVFFDGESFRCAQHENRCIAPTLVNEAAHLQVGQSGRADVTRTMRAIAAVTTRGHIPKRGVPGRYNPRQDLPPGIRKYAHLPGFDAALRRYKAFHGCLPTSVSRHNLPIGPANKTVVLAALGEAPAESYEANRKMHKSNKYGSVFVHKYVGRRPLKAVDGSGRLIVTIPGKHKVSDWIRG